MRSPGDTWDIVSSVGRTALEVATFRAVETERSDRIICDDFARMFVEAAGEQELLGMLANPSVLDDSFFPKMMGPRTKFFDDFLASATGAGLQQVVIVAAGLDARAFRIEMPADTVLYEIDKPAVLEFKNKVLAQHSAQAKAERHSVVADLREDWPTALTAAGFNPKIPSAWMVEGLLMYLPGDAQDLLFERIDALSAPQSQLAGHGAPQGVTLQRMKEFAQATASRSPGGHRPPFDLWYDEPRSDPIEWLQQHGWQVHATTVADLFSSAGRPVPQLPNMEVSELRDRPSFWTATKH